MNLFLSPGANGTGPQGFKETPYIAKSELSSSHTWTHVAALTSQTPVTHCMHGAPCFRYYCSQSFNFQEHVTVQMNKTALFLNNKHLTIVFLTSLLVSTRLFFYFSQISF